jgi:hypothetical protein
MALVRASRFTVIFTATWLAVVVVCSTLVWAVISRAGEGVTSGETPERSESTSSPRNTGTPSTAPTISPSTAPNSSPPSPGETPPTPTAVERTWSGVGGVVVVVCRGTAAELRAATPDDGFAVEVDDTGPDRVEVEFEGRGDSDARTRVRVECVEGEPSFEVDAD